MTIERYATFTLHNDETRTVVALSYPGLELNGTVIAAPLMRENEIAFVSVLHVAVETQDGRRIVAMERMAALSPKMLGKQTGTLAEHDYAISRALSRLFYGN